MSEANGSAGCPNLRARRLSRFFEKCEKVANGTLTKNGLRRRKRINTRRLGQLLEKELTTKINGVPRCEAYQTGGSWDRGTDVVSLLFGLRYRWQCKREQGEWLPLYELLEDYGVEGACVQEPGRQPLMIIPMKMWIDHLEFITAHPPKRTDYP